MLENSRVYTPGTLGCIHPLYTIIIPSICLYVLFTDNLWVKTMTCICLNIRHGQLVLIAGIVLKYIEIP